MTFDLPHVVAIGVVIFVIVLGVEYAARMLRWSRVRRAATVAICAFVVILLLELLWPFGVDA